MNNGGMAVLWIVYAAVLVFMIVAMWKVFVKAGQPGWAAIIPIYNTYIMLKIAAKPEWWLVLWLLVPIANIVVMILTYVAIAEKFGKGGGFAVGMVFLPFIFWPMLAFGSATYKA